MTVLRDVFVELFGMFVADYRLSAAILAVVALAAILVDLAHLAPLIGGAALLIGALGAVVGSAWLAARNHAGK